MSHSNNPRHVAIIPDGNRRWAKAQGLAVWRGHERGVEMFRPIIQTALKEGIPYLSAWMCSKDNLQKRPKEEVEFLYKVFTRLFQELGGMPELDTHNIRVQAFGEWEAYQPPELVASIKALEERTKTHDRFFLNLFDAYDGISEMTRAVSAIAAKGIADVTPADIKAHLYTKDLPPVDLAIRTGGEPHWSGGFLMWDVANAQMHFSDLMWPDFSAVEFEKVLEEYRSRERRHGK